jgi:hypothetical protein
MGGFACPDFGVNGINATGRNSDQHLIRSGYWIRKLGSLKLAARLSDDVSAHAFWPIVPKLFRATVKTARSGHNPPAFVGRGLAR